MYEALRFEVGERGAGIASITLDRPEARNALDERMTGELLDALERVRQDDGIRVLVLTGSGDKAFCSGADLGGLGRAQAEKRPVSEAAEPLPGQTQDARVTHTRAPGGQAPDWRAAAAQVPDRRAADGRTADGRTADGRPEDGWPADARVGDGLEGVRASGPYRLFTAFPRLGKPVIGRLNGHAIAGGLGLAASCDLVVAADDVRLGTPEVNVGLWPMMIMAVINRNVPPKQALKLYFTGQPISAAEAREIGLVTEVVPRAELDARVNELARVIAGKAPLALRRGRDAFYAMAGLPFEEQIEGLLAELVELAATEDAREGITAFLEKRQPRFTGR